MREFEDGIPEPARDLVTVLKAGSRSSVGLAARGQVRSALDIHDVGWLRRGIASVGIAQVVEDLGMPSRVLGMISQSDSGH
jgi:hypothetical protein